MTKLSKFTYNAYIYLRDNIERNLIHYDNPDADFAKILEDADINEWKKDTGVTIKGSIRLENPKHPNKEHLADIQALDFYDSLEGMTPKLATEPETWAYINHFYLHEYGMKRWPDVKTTKASHIKIHWFDNDKMWNTNISARTWWIAHIAKKASEGSDGAFTAREALEVFSEHPEYYHRSMEYEVLRSPMILAECILALLGDAKGINRDGYREMAKEINREAGAKLLDSLESWRMRSIVKSSTNRLMADMRYVPDRKNLKNKKKLKVLSLGAGTQSTVMALMAENGWEGLEKPDFAIFADTMWEPPRVYDHLTWLKKQLSYEVVHVSAGNIRNNILAGVTPDGNRFLDMPVFLVNKDGTKSIAARQCTNHYKIIPIREEIRRRLNLEPGQRVPRDVEVEMWMGISIDESHRIKPNKDIWITNRYPLIEMELTRAQLYTWFEERYPQRYLPRSACVGCPYHSNMEWKWLKDNDPESFQDAVLIDKAIRDDPKASGSLRGTGYLHRDRIGLDTVDFSMTDDYDIFMASECEGLCGV